MGLIAIDPGVHNMAIAVFGDNGVLLDAWNEKDTRSSIEGLLNETLERWGSPSVRLINRLQSHIRLGGVDRNLIVGERQVVYPGAKGLKTNPNDLLDLAMCAGAFYGALCVEMKSALQVVAPAEWKAQVPKDITRKRIVGLLNHSEPLSIKKGGEMHNVYDAIGIGLFALGRAKKGMVKP
jgi:hypothetical protein